MTDLVLNLLLTPVREGGCTECVCVWKESKKREKAQREKRERDRANAYEKGETELLRPDLLALADL